MLLNLLASSWSIFMIGFLILSVMYFIFSLYIVRQVYLMTHTLATEVSPLLKAFAIIHSFFALGVVILFVLLL